MKKTRFLSLLLSAALAFAVGNAASTPAHAAEPALLSLKDLGNATYSLALFSNSPNAAPTSVTLTNGKFNDATRQINVTLVNRPFGIGDVNGDGVADAVVHLAVNTGGSGVLSYIYVVLNDAGQPNPVASAILGDRVNPRRFRIVNGEIRVSYLDRGIDQPMAAAPRISKLRYYKLVGTTLIATLPLDNNTINYAEYPFDLGKDGTAFFVGGKYENKDVPAAATILAKPRATGDLNGDSAPDTVVTIAATAGASGGPVYIGALTNNAYSPGSIATALVGDRVNLTGIAIKGMKITASYLTRKADEPMSARPTVPASKTFVLQAGLLVDESAVTTVSVAPALSGVLTGTVFYLQRIALDPKAEIQVQLEDVSRADAKAELLAEQIIQAEGKNVPFAFELKYDPGKIAANGRYNLRARITVAGKLAWMNTTATPVLTNGAPTTGVEVKVDQITAQPDTGPGAAMTNTLARTNWQLQESSQDGKANPELGANLNFSQDGKVSGKAGCNQMAGAYMADGSTLKFTPLASTLMACADAAMKQEGWYTKSLQAAVRYEIQGGTLRIYFGNDAQFLSFSKN